MLVRTPADLGEVLRHARRISGVSQTDLAEWLGVSRYYISSLENGEPTERLERLLAAMALLGFELHAAPRGELHSRPIGPLGMPGSEDE